MNNDCVVTGKLMGGLGNQLFIMASCYGYAKKHNLKSVIHIPSISYRTPNTEHYENTVFRRFDKVYNNITDIFNEPDKYALSYIEIPKMNGLVNMLHGYFQNEKYFNFCKEEFIQQLFLPNKPILKNTCFIHIRRGDYVNISLHFIDFSKYYINAINYIMMIHNNVQFLVFSDDIKWCKEQDLFKGEQFIFYDNDDEVESMMVMSSCDIGGICANSSFSWWGSYMNKNKNKTVIFPNKWFNDSQFVVDIGYKNSIILPIDRIISMMKFKVFSSFCSSTDAMNAYTNVCDISNGLIKFIDTDDYTHALILNTATPYLQINKEKVLGLSFEPYIFQKNILSSKQFQEYCINTIGCYLIATNGNLPSPFISHYTYQWHKWQRPHEFKEYKKTNKMSIVLSNKTMTNSHTYRHNLVDNILKTDMNIDIWGRGSKLHGSDIRIKGDFINEEPYESYEYTIAIENSPEDYNITEKFTDAIGYNCKVLYYGAPKINDLFGPRCCVKLTGNIELDIQIIQRVYNNGIEIDMTSIKHELFHRNAYLPHFLYHHFNKDVIFKT